MFRTRPQTVTCEVHMSHRLNSLKGVIQGILYVTTIGVTKGDTRSLGYGSSRHFSVTFGCLQPVWLSSFFEMLCSLVSAGKVFGNISGIYPYIVPIYP